VSGGKLLKVPTSGVRERCDTRRLAGVESFLVVDRAIAVVFELGQEFVRLRPACPAAHILPSRGRLSGTHLEHGAVLAGSRLCRALNAQRLDS